jgi:prepilin signal peptidase PulO-like enzyme (type II secretory pathway)
MSVGFLGFILGSFVNAYVYRVKTNKRGQVKLSIINGRSICPNCKHLLGPMDLVPVFSWLFLRGRCRYCKKPISSQYPIVELLTVMLFLLSLLYWPGSLIGSGLGLFAIWLFILTILISLAVYDIKYMLLPNKMVIPLVCLVLAFVIYRALVDTPGNWEINSIFGFLIGGGIFYLIYQISGGKWIGGGDVKLGAILGLLLGSAFNSLLMIFIASLLGSLVGIPLMLTKKQKKPNLIPFGPFLILAAVILMIFSMSIIKWLNTRNIYV